MPTVNVVRDRLFDALGRSYTQEEFDALCFDFGLELDDVTTEKAMRNKEKHLEGESLVDGDEEVIYKIEVPANRYDLLCLEGIARALRVFTMTADAPVYKVRDIPQNSMLKMIVKPETRSIRPYIVCAILRGITFDEARFKSFIDLQEKLHQNICRRRTLVAIGTHDLDTISGPFHYEAAPPQEISFVPLKEEKCFRADELMEYYKSDVKLKKFLPIIEHSPVFPVIYDSNRTILSMPPIINSAHSAISTETKNVFIECTATDLVKAQIVLNTLVTMFCEYCERKFEVEPVEVLYYDGEAHIYPDLSISKRKVPLSDITNLIGISLEASKVVSLLNKMQLQAEHSLLGDGSYSISVSIPPTRSDILHSRDIVGDVAIAYGYNNIPKSIPTCMTVGGLQPLTCFSDKIRGEVSRAGYMEVLTWVLCSHDENFSMLNRGAADESAVLIANPRSSEFQVVRTSLMSGLLKTIKHNIDHPRPIKIFEVGDVVKLDESKDVGAVNNRQLAALYCNVFTSGFEEIIGLMKRICKVCKPHLDDTLEMEASNEPQYLRDRQCKIIIEKEQIGTLGIVHPEVLTNFGIPDPCSYLEMDIQRLL